MRRGYLLATTKWLRYVQTIPTRADNFWSYDFKVDVSGGVAQGGIIQTASGDLFQTRWGRARNFRDLYAAMQQAAVWDAENAPEPTPVTVMSRPAPQQLPNSTLSEELERLGALRERGHLTDEEFQAAKRQVLGL